MLSGMHCIVYNTLSAIFIFMIIFLLLWLIFIIMITCICTILSTIFMCCFHMKWMIFHGYTFSIKIYCVQSLPLKFVWPSHKVQQTLKSFLNQNKQETLWKYDNLMVKNLHSPEFGCKKNHENYFFCFMDL